MVFAGITFSTKVLKIIGVLVGAYLFRYVLIKVVKSGLKGLNHGVKHEGRKERIETLESVLSSLISFTLGILALLIILTELGVDIAPLLASVGVLGLSIGLAAQTLVKDYISGFFILLENQFNVGDKVELEGKKGTVLDVTLRTTLLEDEDGSTHLIPNSSINSVTKIKK